MLRPAIQPHHSSLKRYTLIAGVLFFSWMFYLAWHYCLERMLNFDPTFFTFRMIDTLDFEVTSGRYGELPPQIWPLMLIRSGAPLFEVIRAYSASFVVLYILIFLMLYVVHRHYLACWVLMLTLVLGFRDVFYYSTAELHLGLACMVWFWALLDTLDETHGAAKIIRLTGMAALMVFISMCNPITLLPMLFIIGADAVKKERLRTLFPYMLAGLTLTWNILYLKVINASDYDDSKLITLSTFFQQLPHVFTLPSTRYFLKFAWEHFGTLLLTLLVSWLALAGKKEKQTLWFSVAGIIGFLIIIFITYYKGESPVMYQNYYTVLGLFAGVLLVYATREIAGSGKWVLFVSVLLVINLWGIQKASAVMTARIEFIDALVKKTEKYSERKFLVTMKQYPWEIMWVRWGFPFETLLYSSLQSPDSAKTFYLVEHIEDLDEWNNKPTVFFGPDWAPFWFSTDKLNRNYFRIREGTYRKLAPPSAKNPSPQ